MKEIDCHRYFDWAATAPFDTEILQSALEESVSSWANPSSLYRAGTQAKAALDGARNKIADILGVEPKCLFFTSGGTESDHIPLLSILNATEKDGSVLVSSIEHPALREQCAALSRLGYTVTQIPAQKDGIILPETAASLVTENTRFITVMAVNNETGAIQPVKEIARAVSEKNAGKRRPKFHVDYVQGLGKIPFELKDSGIDSAAFSAHKIGGPRGTGLLYIANPSSIEAFLKGGGQERNIRSGTENVFGALAFAKAVEKYAIHKNNSKMLERFELQKKYINEFIQNLLTIKTCRIIPEEREDSSYSDKHFSPWVLQAAFEKIPGQVMLRALDAKGFSVSTGSACSSKKKQRPVLEAMHVPPALRENTVRFSFGSRTEKSDIDGLFAAVKDICSQFK